MRDSMILPPPRKIWLWVLAAWGVALCYPALDELQTLPTWKSVCAVEFSPDGRTLAAGLYDGRSFNDDNHFRTRDLGQTVALFDARTGTRDSVLVQFRYEGSTSGASYERGQFLAFSPDGSTLAVASWDGRVLLWDWRSKRLQQTLQSQLSRGLEVAFCSGGRKLIVGGRTGLTIWDTGTFGEGSRVDSDMSARKIATSQDSALIAAGDWVQSWVELRDCDSGRKSRIDLGSSDGIRALAFSSDGRSLAIGGEESVLIWEVESQTKRFEIRSPSAANLAFSPDGKLLTMPGEEGLRFYSAETGKPLPGMANARHIRSLAWSPDGTLLATGDYSGNVAVWEMGERQRLWTARLQGPSRGPFYYTVAAGIVWLAFIAVTIWRAASIPSQTSEARARTLAKSATAAGSG